MTSRERRIGRYLVGDVLARGGMATVRAGKLVGSSGFERPVAIKTLHPMFADDDAHRRALADEARLSARVRHPNVVPTLDVLEEDGELCLVMEYVHGLPLSRLVALARKNGERLPLDVVSAIVQDALQGLHAAHEARDEGGSPLNIVHRDVSPQNVVVGADGVTRLIDFGIAKALHRVQATQTGNVKGKIAYIAREQLLGAPATRQTDVYGMGVVLWEALTGERMYDDDPGPTAARILSETAPPPSSVAPDVPLELDEVVARATSPDRRRRFATAAEMLAALADAAPRAPLDVVAGIVERCGADELARREAIVRRVEAFPVETLSADTLSPAAAVAAPPAPSLWRARNVVFAVATVLSAAATAVVVPSLRGAHDAGSSATATAPPPPAAPTEVPATAPPAVSDDEAVVELPDTPAAEDGTKPARAPRRATRAACDPPYFVGSDGRKHYRASCWK